MLQEKVYFEKVFRIIEILCLSFLLFSCSSVNESIYKSDFPLTSQKAFSRDSSYTVLIPKGWFYSFDNTHSSSDIILIQNDFNALFSIVPINTDSKLNSDSRSNGLINFSKIMKKTELHSKLISIGKPEFFKINNMECAAYQYYNNSSLPVRTVLFEFNKHFYELNAYITEAGLNGKLIPGNVYDVQNSILYSLKKTN